MLATKNWSVPPSKALGLAAVLHKRRHGFPGAIGRGACLALAAGMVFVAGCTPAGPRALLDGEKLLNQGKYGRAIVKLHQATQLLPSNAQAWNHLGLAYHKAGQLDAAQKAYEQARRCDLNLTVVRFNLGCLLLEQNNPQAAVAELTTYTLLQRDSAAGWLKLGVAHLRARQWDSAETSLQNALRLQNNLAEAWNALGLIQVQRRRPREALNCFSSALRKQPQYPPALLNSAIVCQHHLNDRALALQKYQEFLAAAPTSPEAAAVQQAVRQLRSDLAPPPRKEPPPAVAAAPPPAPPETNAAPARQPAPNLPAARFPSNTVLVAEPPSTNRAWSILTNLLASAEPPPAQRKPAESPRRVEVTPPPPSSPRVDTNLAKAEPAVKPPPPKVEVVQVKDEPAPRLAQDPAFIPLPPVASPPAKPPASLDDATALLAKSIEQAPRELPPEKPRGIERLNPTTWFRGKRRTAPSASPADGSRKQLAAVSQPASTSPGVERTVTPTSIPLYSYHSLTKPAPGDRLKADPFFAGAIQAHRDGRLSDAVRGYRQATLADPSFFEAHYNLGLAAYELRDIPQSLSAYETALSINPTSVNARYNFALALERGGYFRDAAAELENLLVQHANEARAHFALASLYAEQLGQPAMARLHYQRVIELEPQHPQAGAIRYWLAANPP